MDVKLSPQDIKKFNGYVWKFFIGCFAFFVLMIGLTVLGAFGTLPSFHDLENPKSDQASIIYASDNMPNSSNKQVLGEWYWQNRSSVTFKAISPNVINALVAKEDNHFNSHSGIDFWRLFTIIPYNLVGKKQGASTITEQLAKNLFAGEPPAHNPVKRIIQKLKELIIAVRLEKHYTKQEIITMYLNTVDFGSNTYGISSAAQTYFNTVSYKLTPDQAAVLIQMLTSTTRNSPVRHPLTALHNRNFVLKRMFDQGYLTHTQFDACKAKPLGLDYHPVDRNEGLAPYFRAELRKQVKKLLAERSIFKSDGITPYDVDRDGLKIYTTIIHECNSMQKMHKGRICAICRCNLMSTGGAIIWLKRYPITGYCLTRASAIQTAIRN